jgi:hypothetical protein
MMQKLNKWAPYVLVLCGALILAANYFGNLNKPMYYSVAIGFMLFGAFSKYVTRN